MRNACDGFSPAAVDFYTAARAKLHKEMRKKEKIEKIEKK